MIFIWGQLFSKEGERPSPYQKKKYLFDSNAEYALFKILLELYSDKYHIFPQINYSHVVEVKNMERKEWQKYRNRIDRKSADFVLANKQTAVPELVIELDGPSHENRQARDGFINDLMRMTDLPIVHLKTGNFDKEFIKGEIEKALAPK